MADKCWFMILLAALFRVFAGLFAGLFVEHLVPKHLLNIYFGRAYFFERNHVSVIKFKCPIGHIHGGICSFGSFDPIVENVLTGSLARFVPEYSWSESLS